MATGSPFRDTSEYAGIPRIAVIVPSYRVTKHILSVLAGIGPDVTAVYVVDDCCPDGTAELVERECSDPRVTVLRHEVNLGVGGAVMTGYKQAIRDGMSIAVKVDGDGQMDPRLVSCLVAPIVSGHADYVKGNRFYDLAQINRMPAIRIVGNAALSFMAKFSTGYWHLFDPTNGFTAISVPVAAHLPFEKVSNRFFFETDLLFRLNTLRAVVVDMPMHAMYGDETSNLQITTVLPEFLLKHMRNFLKRIFYSYFLRDMSVASVELLCGLALLSGGFLFGAYHWIAAIFNNATTPVGTIMLSVLPIIVGVQLLLAFLAYDIANTPRRPIGDELRRLDALSAATRPTVSNATRRSAATPLGSESATPHN